MKPDNHCINAAERVIQTLKNNFITGPVTVDVLLPLQLWYYLLAQAYLTLNLLQNYRHDPSKSAYEVPEGKLRHPIGPTRQKSFNL